MKTTTHDKVSLVFIVLFFVSLGGSAQEHYFYGGVFDAATRIIVDSVKVTLFSEDGVAQDSMVTDKNVKVGYDNATWYFWCGKHVPKGKLLFSAVGYEEREIELPAISFKSRETMRQMPNVYLRRKPKEKVLGEAVVQATKIKFYHKGDTLVFNADAFEVGEGSMLDALIRQLPGVELKKGGEIFVNGRRMEDLLLNGQKFFGEDRSLMLDNLPAYTVKRVQVLEKSTELSRRMGKEAEKKIFTMDVRLKKAYSVGWLGHLLGGVGTHNRKVGQLFAIRFTPHSRLSVYGNANNISDEHKPGENEDWTPNDLSDYQVTTKKGGFDYLFTHPEERYKVYGNTQVLSQKSFAEQQETGISFVADGSLWKYKTLEEHQRDFGVTTQNTWEFHPWKHTWTWLSLNASYQDMKKQGANLQGLFSQSPFTQLGLTDSLRVLSPHATWGQSLLHRLTSEYLNKRKAFAGNASFSLQRRVWGNDMILANSSISYSQERSKDFLNRLVVYPHSQTVASNFDRLFSKMDPSSSLSAEGGATYMAWMNAALLFTADYSLRYSRTRQDFRHYLLGRVAGWGENARREIGTLPSEVEYLKHIDRQNSFELCSHAVWHNLALNLKYETSLWYVLLKFPFTREHIDFKYARGGFDGKIRKNYLFFVPEIDLRRRWDEGNSYVNFKYSHSAQQPATTDLVEGDNTLDPLNIMKGNSALKPEHTHNLEAELQWKPREDNTTYSLNSSLSWERNSIGYASVYDRHTGVTVYTPRNVDGNCNWDIKLTHSRFLDKKQQLSLEITSYLMLNRGVDFLGTSNTAPIRSVVHTLWTTSDIALGYNHKNFSLTLLGGGGFNQATSKRADFTAVRVGEFHYGFTLKSPRLWNFQLSTDLKMYSRRGYENPAANTNELIWNARLHRELSKRWSVELEGFDILRRLSNTTQSINSQGHVETFKNVIPAYFMLKCRLQLTKKG